VYVDDGSVGDYWDKHDFNLIDTPFSPCLAWAGSRAGHVFKQGCNGRGYYTDYGLPFCRKYIFQCDLSALENSKLTTTTIDITRDLDRGHDEGAGKNLWAQMLERLGLGQDTCHVANLLVSFGAETIVDAPHFKSVVEKQEVVQLQSGCLVRYFHCTVTSAPHQVRRMLRNGPWPCSLASVTARDSDLHKLAESCSGWNHTEMAIFETLLLWTSAKRLVTACPSASGATGDMTSTRQQVGVRSSADSAKIDAALMMSEAILTLTHIATQKRTHTVCRQNSRVSSSTCSCCPQTAIEQEDALKQPTELILSCNQLQIACGEIFEGGEPFIWSSGGAAVAKFLSRLIQELKASALLLEIPVLMCTCCTTEIIAMMYLLSSSETTFHCRAEDSQSSDHEKVDERVVCQNKRCRTLLRRNKHSSEICFNCGFALGDLVLGRDDKTSIEDFETWGNFVFAQTGLSETNSILHAEQRFMGGARVLLHYCIHTPWDTRDLLRVAIGRLLEMCPGTTSSASQHDMHLKVAADLFLKFFTNEGLEMLLHVDLHDCENICPSSSSRLQYVLECAWQFNLALDQIHGRSDFDDCDAWYWVEMIVCSLPDWASAELVQHYVLLLRLIQSQMNLHYQGENGIDFGQRDDDTYYDPVRDCLSLSKATSRGDRISKASILGMAIRSNFVEIVDVILDMLPGVMLDRPVAVLYADGQNAEKQLPDESEEDWERRVNLLEDGLSQTFPPLHFACKQLANVCSTSATLKVYVRASEMNSSRPPVEISGVGGPFADEANGLYLPSGEMWQKNIDGIPVKREIYYKEGGMACITYSPSRFPKNDIDSVVCSSVQHRYESNKIYLMNKDVAGENDAFAFKGWMAPPNGGTANSKWDIDWSTHRTLYTFKNSVRVLTTTGMPALQQCVLAGFVFQAEIKPHCPDVSIHGFSVVELWIELKNPLDLGRGMGISVEIFLPTLMEETPQWNTCFDPPNTKEQDLTVQATFTTSRTCHGPFFLYQYATRRRILFPRLTLLNIDQVSRSRDAWRRAQCSIVELFIMKKACVQLVCSSGKNPFEIAAEFDCSIDVTNILLAQLNVVDLKTMLARSNDITGTMRLTAALRMLSTHTDHEKFEFDLCKLILTIGTERCSEILCIIRDVAQNLLHHRYEAALILCAGRKEFFTLLDTLLRHKPHGFQIQDLPLLPALQHNCIDILTLLLSAGADPNAVRYMGAHGVTCLHLAIERCVYAPLANLASVAHVVKLLLEANADCNIKGGVSEGTPLHEAVKISSNEGAKVIVSLVLAHGNANVHIKNKQKKSAVDLARPWIRDLLVQHQQRKSSKKKKKSAASKLVAARLALESHEPNVASSGTAAQKQQRDENQPLTFDERLQALLPVMRLYAEEALALETPEFATTIVGCKESHESNHENSHGSNDKKALLTETSSVSLNFALRLDAPNESQMSRAESGLSSDFPLDVDTMLGGGDEGAAGGAVARTSQAIAPDLAREEVAPHAGKAHARDVLLADALSTLSESAWDLRFTREFKEQLFALHSKPVLLQSIIKQLFRLANGEQTRGLFKQLKGSPRSLPIFESPVKTFNDGDRFLWTCDVDYSPRIHLYTDCIRLWRICKHDEVQKGMQWIIASFQRGRTSTMKRGLKTVAGSGSLADGRRLPRQYDVCDVADMHDLVRKDALSFELLTLEDVDPTALHGDDLADLEVLFTPPAVANADAFNVLKFYQLSDEVLRSLQSFTLQALKDVSPALPEFPFIPDDREDMLIGTAALTIKCLSLPTEC